MSENRILELLARKMANEATAAELRELQYLLTHHPDGVYYEELFDQLWTKNTEPEADTDAAYLLHTLKHPDITKEDDTTQNRLKPMLVGAGAFVFLLVSGLFLWLYLQQNTSNTGYTEILAGKGIRKNISLPDGTKVWLNSNSKLRFANNIKEGKTRRVTLEGEAYFDVAKDKQHPFIISTQKFSIRVLGTAFNVRAYHGDTHTEAALIHGSIELTLADNSKQKIMLKPNEKFTLTQKSGFSSIQATRKLSIQSIKPVDVQNQHLLQETSWIDNKLVFDNETFEEMIPRLERWYNVSIDLQIKKAASYRYTGVFETETLEQALKAMQLIKPFKYEIKNDEVTVK